MIATREKLKVHMDEKTREHPNNTDLSIVREIPREIDFRLECEVTSLAKSVSYRSFLGNVKELTQNFKFTFFFENC